MTFDDIEENFFYNPLDFSLRLKRLDEIQQLLYELYRATLLGKFSKSNLLGKPSLPLRFSKEFVLNEKNVLVLKGTSMLIKNCMVGQNMK